jgi:hypothetical protein
MLAVDNADAVNWGGSGSSASAYAEASSFSDGWGGSGSGASAGASADSFGGGFGECCGCCCCQLYCQYLA